MYGSFGKDIWDEDVIYWRCFEVNVRLFVYVCFCYSSEVFFLGY